MGNNMSDKKISELLKNKDKLKGKKPNEILKNLDPSDAKKVKEIMKNPELTKKIINSPEAQELLKKLMGGNSKK